MSDRFGNIPIQPPESPPTETKPVKPGKKALKVPVKTVSKAKQRPKNKGWLWIIAAVLIIGLYSTLGFLGVPFYVSKILPEHFQEKTGLTLVPTTVKFNPFTFRFETGEARILSESGTTIASLHAMIADVAPASLYRLSVVCNSVILDELVLNIARQLDGSYNFQQVFGAKKDSKPSELFNFNELPFFLSLNNISIKNSSITFNDAPAGKIHTVKNIQLDLPTFSNIPFQTDHYLRPHFSAVINGSPVELTGQASLGESDGKDISNRLSLDIHDFDLTIYSDYLPFNLPLDFRKGRANGKLDLLFDPQNKNGDKISIDFQLQISEAELIKENESIVMAVPTALLRGNLQPVSRKIHLTEVVVKEPKIISLGESFLDNIKQPRKQTAQATQPEGTAAAAASYSLIIDQLLLDKGTVQLFSGKKDQGPAAIWNDIQLIVKNYRSAPENIESGDEGSFILGGARDGAQTSFSWQGSFSPGDNLSGSLSIQKFDTKNLSKIINVNLPFDLEGIADLKGQLSFSSKKSPQAKFSYKLSDAETTIENFAVLEKGQKIVAAQIAKLSALTIEGDSIDFGNVYLQKSSAQFVYGRIPALFSTFGSDKYRMKGVDFGGNVTINPTEKTGEKITFTDVSLKANKLDDSQSTENNLSISGKTAATGIFRAQGDISLKPFTLSIKTGFKELPAQSIFPFFTTSSLLGNITGNLSGKGLFKLPATSFNGELQLTDYSGEGPKTKALSWQNAVFRDLNYTSKPFHLGITSAEIDQARLSWEITREDSGPMQYLAEFFRKNLPKNTSPVDIKEISFTNGKISINDRRLTPDWQAEVSDFAGNIKDVHSGNITDKSVFSFTGKLDETPFNISGETALFSRSNNGAYKFSLENYPLASFNEQLSPKTDVDTSSGEFSLTLDCSWQEQQFISSGTSTFVDVSPVSETSESALPLALITGDDNTFELPFSFSRAEPIAKVTLLDELLTSFQTLVVKGSVSPFLLATGDFTDLIGHEYVNFNPGEFMLSDIGREMLIRYSALLIAHPHVGLILSGGIDKDIDRLAMKDRLTAIEKQRVSKENERLFQEWQETKRLHEKNLAEQQKTAGAGGKIVEKDIPQALLTEFKPLQPVPVEVDEAMLVELAQKRINVLVQYFTTQLALEPERISVVMPDAETAESETPITGVTINLKAIN